MAKKLIAAVALVAMLFTSVGVVYDRDVTAAALASVNSAANDEYLTLGDCNADGIVNAKDVVTLKLYLKGQASVNTLTADANQDGVIDSNDVKCISGFISNGTTELIENTRRITNMSPENGASVQLANSTMQSYYSEYSFPFSFEGYTQGVDAVYYPDGLTLSWEVSKTPDSYKLYISLNSDMSDSEVYTLTSASYTHKALMYGKEYYWRVDAIYGSEAVSSDVNTFTTEYGIRTLEIPNVSNTRDIGGYMTSNGKRVKQGMVYRGGALDEASNNTALTDEGLAFMRDVLGIVTDVDLRGNTESGASPLGSDVQVLSVSAPYYASGNGIDNASYQANMAHAVRVFANSYNYPIYAHCTLGRDRTGTLIFLINGLLGVSLEDLCMDYELSRLSVVGAGTDSATAAQCQANLNRLIDYLNSLGGQNLQENIEIYLKSIGITEAEIAEIRRNLLEDAPGDNNYILQVTTAYPTTSNMMSYVVVSNDVVSVIDGGMDMDAERLLQVLRQTTGKERPTVDHWLFTHPHWDHVGAFVELMDNYSSEITINNVYYNIFDESVYQYLVELNGEDSSEIQSHIMYNQFKSSITNSAVKNRVEVQVGSIINISDDVSVEVLFVPGPDNNGLLGASGSAVNNSSVIYMMTICEQKVLFLGDAGVAVGPLLLAAHNAGTINLDADIVQMAHHGQGGVGQDVYEVISPKACMWPSLEWVHELDSTREVRNWMDDLGVTMHYKQHDGDDKLTFPYDFMPDDTVWQVGNQERLAMSYVATSDGKLCVIDGGNEADAPALYKFLQNITGSESPAIDTWILTHPGKDHVGAFGAMMSDSGTYSLTVNKVYYSEVNSAWNEKYGSTSLWGSYAYDTMTSAMNTGLTNGTIGSTAVISKGQNISFGTASFEVLYTLKDCYSTITGSGYVSLQSRDAASILRLSFSGTDKDMLFMSDAYLNTATYLYNYSLSKVNDVFAVQMALHGQSVFTDLYGAMDPKVCFWPTYRDLWDTDNVQNTLAISTIVNEEHHKAFEGAYRYKFSK